MAKGQETESTVGLINTLATNQDGVVPIIPCGENDLLLRQNGEIKEKLVRRGPSILPELEKTLDWIEARDRQGNEVPNARLLLEVYVRVKGPSAYPRIVQMIGHAHLRSLQLALDESVATLFGLTSVVSFQPGRTEMRSNSIWNCRLVAPRDGLDHFIMAWEAGDRSEVYASLGAQAKGRLDRLTTGKTWEAFRSEVWQIPAGTRVTVGYHFPVISISNRMSAIEIDATFHNAAGKACGASTIHFAVVPLVPGSDGPLDYLVDNDDLPALLKVLSSCAQPIIPTP